MDFSESPIWVQIHDMPLGCMNQAVGEQIDNSLGKVVDVAVAEDDVGWGRYLRVRVTINLFKLLERGRTLFIAGNPNWVSFKYEKLPVFCFWCGCIIHGPTSYNKMSTRKSNHAKGLDGWGLWLRADGSSRGPGNTEGTKLSRPSSPVESDEGREVVNEMEQTIRMEGMGKEEEMATSVERCNLSKSDTLTTCVTDSRDQVRNGRGAEIKATKKRKYPSEAGRSLVNVFEKMESMSYVAEGGNNKKEQRLPLDGPSTGGPGKGGQNYQGPMLKGPIRNAKVSRMSG
jgi:hypothetical protein